MGQIANNYAKVLYEMGISKEVIGEARQIFSKTPQLTEVFVNPTISKKKKHSIIEKVFPKEMHKFFKVLCDYGNFDLIEEIFSEYEKYYDEKNGILKARLTYVTAPDDRRLGEIKTLLMNKYHKKSVEITLNEDQSILGGFIVEAQNCETDWSLRGRLQRLQQGFVRR